MSSRILSKEGLGGSEFRFEGLGLKGLANQLPSHYPGIVHSELRFFRFIEAC